MLCMVYAGQASAFWPFAAAPRTLSMEPAYGGVCEECDLSGRILAGAKLSNSVFNRADFSDAVLVRANASNSEFEHANFTGADLSHAVFAEADVTDARFDNANIAGADLSTARGLTQRQLNRACGDVHTRVPRGLRVRTC
jgi:uncharacterized protein YjbI with pentapeptide repeats